jgi:6,7-dimethyl-8-ribityllumazine synthase
MSSFHPHEINVRKGSGSARGLRIAIVVSRFNNLITDRLLEGALEEIGRAEADKQDVDVISVPGAWEMPVVAAELARLGRTDAIVCLGCVVRGDTPHFDFVAGENARGLMAVSSETGIPIANGVLTTNTMQQALDRAGGIMGNKGAEAATCAVEMAHLLRELKGAKG